MAGTLTWNSGAVTVAFGDDNFYADETAQTWTWNSTSVPLTAAARSQTFATSNATGNTLTVVQTRPSGAVTFKATGVSRGTTSVTLSKQS